MTAFVPIVEGHGEVLSVEKLLWRVARDANPAAAIHVNPPIRVKAGAFCHDASTRSRFVRLAAAKARQLSGVVLVLLDSEDECPARLGPELLASIASEAADVPAVVTLAHREYETWFVAAAESLRGSDGLAADAVRPADPEVTRDAKGWLSERMVDRYDPVRHQLAFTRSFDLVAARSVASFDRFCRKISALVAASP
jgi:hypothetical protein